jgi:hypothetical protein
MSVPEHQVIQYHVECCVENGLISLPLPELDVEAAFVIADPSIKFFYVSHIFSHKELNACESRTIPLINRDVPHWVVALALIAS